MMDQQLHTVEVYNKYVKEYMNKFMSLDLYKDTFDFLIENISVGGKVLELGCGPGNVVKYLKTKRDDLNILGIDLAPGMIKAAKKENPGSTFKLMDIRNAGQIKEKFDAVVAAFCLPYLSYKDLPLLFKNMERLTKDEGLVYLSFMEGTREKSGYEKTSFTGDSEIYITYYRRNEIETLLNKHGFQTKKFYTKDYPETDGSTTTDIIYIAKKTPYFQ